LAFNRDELLARPAGLQPEVRSFGACRAVLPLDPLGGGTWIAVNDAGLALALLNVNPPTPRGPSARLRSRGTILPTLLSVRTLGEAVRRAAELPASAFAPFRLVLVQSGQLAQALGDGNALRLVGPAPLDAPMLYTSSGLGDHLVEGPRRRLFEERFQPGQDLRAAQEAFHRHSWPAQQHLSVCMRRADAATVSHTCIELDDRRAVLTYFPEAPDQGPAAQVLVLPLRRV
jgi:hypothetical protein